MDPIIIEYVRLCPDCQKRKPTNHHTTAYSTPCAPFEVWQVDLVGPLPMSPQGLQTDVNSVPRSPIIVLHTPYVVNICVRPEATVIVSLLAKGIEMR
jgi:hypothetical protein